MKTGGEKASATVTPAAVRNAGKPFFAKAGGGDFFAPAVHSTAPSVQMKLAVNKSGDKLEREADTMAEQVMRMPATPAAADLLTATEPNVWRQPTEHVQRKEGDAPSIGPGPQASLQSSLNDGQPLSPAVRRFMETRFGADFNHVRVHNDSSAARLSNQLDARAFTYRNHVFFARDQYNPDTSEGKQLLAHELTHTLQQGHAVQRKGGIASSQNEGAATPDIQKVPARAKAEAITSSGVVDISSGTFSPSEQIKQEIELEGHKGLLVRIVAKGLAGEGEVKVRADRQQTYDSMDTGHMPLLNAWTRQLGGMYLNVTIRNSAITNGFASLKPGGGDRNDWLEALRKNAAMLGGLGLSIGNLPSPVNKVENGILTVGVENLHVVVGGFLDATFSISVENLNKPKIAATADINIKGAVSGKLLLDNAQDKLAGQVSLAVDFKAFSGSAIVKYNADGTVDVSGMAAYTADKLSGEIHFVATDAESARSFAKDAIAAAGGTENVQAAPPPAPVPVPKSGKKDRALAATGQLSFNLTKWFAGTVNVVVDGKGAVTVIGKIAPPGEIELFRQKDWDKELIKFEAKAYYGIPVVGNLNLFANISLHALAKLGPAKIYNIEILGTYSTDPEIQKSIQISGSINISAYAGLRLRAEGGAGIEIASHDLKFGIGLNADVGVKAYADARPTIGYRDPGEFYISGTLDMVAQPMLGLNGEFFIALRTPWWSPLSDDKWTWPLFSKEWPLSDPIGISASVKEYVLGSGKVPEVELKPPEFDPSKFMTSMVDRTLPDKSGGPGAGQGAFKEDGSVTKPAIPPKKPAPKTADPALGKKKGTKLKGGKSGSPDPQGAKEKTNAKLLESAAKALKTLKGKGPFTRGSLDQELGGIKRNVSGANFDVRPKGATWVVTPIAGGKPGKGLELEAKGGAALDTAMPNKSVARSFALPSESHTVTAQVKEGKLQLLIASDRETDVLTMLYNAKQEVTTDTTRNAEQKKHLLVLIADLQGMVKHMYNDWIVEPKQQLDFGAWSERRLSQVIGIFSHFGAEGIGAFRDFKGKPLTRRYLPANYDVRGNLYIRGSGMSRSRNLVETTGRSEVHRDADSVIRNRKTNPAAADLAWSQLVANLRAPAGVTRDTLTMAHIRDTDYEVDHIEVLSIHWTSTKGHDSGDKARWEKSDVAKLRYITKKENLARTKEQYLDFVGQNFISIYAQGGQPNAKKIDGKPFLDSPGGNPI